MEPDELLRLLAEAKPREGLEARVLRRVEMKREEMQRASGRLAPWRWPFAVAAVALVLVCVLMPWHQKFTGTKPLTVAAMPPVKPAPEPPTLGLSATRRRTTSRSVALRVRPEAATPVVARPIPLTAQERLLLAFAAAQKRRPSADLSGIVVSEVVTNHGLGRNAISELLHQPLQPMLYNPLVGENE